MQIITRGYLRGKRLGVKAHKSTTASSAVHFSQAALQFNISCLFPKIKGGTQ
jgi:hypothetical protein